MEINLGLEEGHTELVRERTELVGRILAAKLKQLVPCAMQSASRVTDFQDSLLHSAGDTVC